MIQHSYSLTTTAVTQAQIWKLISDIDNWKSWDTGVTSSQLHGRFETGQHFTLQPQGGPKVRIQLEEVRANEYFRDLTRFPLAKMYGEHWYEVTPEGLKLTVTMTMKGLLAPLWNKIVMKNIVAGMEEDVQRQIEAAGKL
ncbi:polyketide cyclase [Chitinophaga sp. G-6-1-13]|uniref:Polyketide cyclase n=1 Tax=Chitinophaga fulva TaxID=2728842 RepID=A0A848GVU7_9BACT|nr:SRPBCC family protein [Chitinophaga fulva]NML39818.1 polyketide cyclase [Chitinophaga fulva]